MSEKTGASLEPTAEQVRYAAVLEKGMYFGLLCLFVTFVIYVSGIMRPYIPHDHLANYWQQSVHEYLVEAKIQAGWSWIGMLGYGDFLNFIGVVILAGVTVPCYLSIIPLLLKKRDFIYTTLVVLEVIVLTTAASGIIQVGH